MNDLNCPGCKGSNLVKYGTGGAGRQKYRCRGCGRQFVAGSDHLLDPATKTLVMNMLSAGIEPLKIKATVPGISLRWIYELRNRV